MLTFAEKISFTKNDNIQIYFGRNSFGVDFFCYIRCNLTGYKKLKQDFASKLAAAPETYGEVIYKDYLPEPDEKAKTFLANWLKTNA